MSLTSQRRGHAAAGTQERHRPGRGRRLWRLPRAQHGQLGCAAPRLGHQAQGRRRQADPLCLRHYPGDKACNTSLPKTFFEERLSCHRRQAEATSAVGGPEAYWKMHAWLLSHQQGFGPASIRTAAAATGLDPDALASAMDRPDVQAAIANDLSAAAVLGVGQIPCVYVNGRFIGALVARATMSWNASSTMPRRSSTHLSSEPPLRPRVPFQREIRT